ncbi:MAG: response regulator [Lachnospiraceae bacterium]|nr:response regulator [Lachnospiraceae bacterium]
MKETKIEKNELFQTAHMMILVAFTIFSLILTAESLIMGWERWALIMIGAAVVISWTLHIRQLLTAHSRLWIYSLMMMAIFFFYGIHETSTFDLAVIMSALVLLFTMTGLKNLINACLATYFVTMAYGVALMIKNGTQFDTLLISRILMHLVVVFMTGWFARTIIDRWASVLEESMREIEVLRDSTDRLDDFLANVSHEIRTPVNAVIGLSGVCIEKAGGGELDGELRSIRAAGKRVGEQISDILDYSEIDRGMLVRNEEDYMLDSLLNDLVEELRPYKRPEIELIIDVDPAIPSVMVTDVIKLKKILWHLIMNGLKYTMKGGVYVRISSVEESYGINLCIEITDTGIGMTSTEVERMAERFYQANSGRTRMGGGLGLGFPIVAGFVSSLGGFMTIDSKPGKGTSVHISLPQRVSDPSSCMTINNREDLCLGAYLHFDKFINPDVREYYNTMVSNIVHGLGVHMHRVDNLDDLKRLTSSLHLTHLFIAEEEYATDPAYIEELAKEMLVVVVADSGFKLPENSRSRILEKPFYCFPVATILNSDRFTQARKTKMLCPGLEVLVVDDEPMNLTVARGVFSSYGMNVSTALSGPESIEQCRKRSFDLIFMDHMMPGMDGIETMHAIRSDRSGACKDAPFIALTANTVSTAREMFLSEGFDGFVSKPIEPADLERTLKKVLPKSAIRYESVTKEDLPDEEGSRYTILEAIGIKTDSGLRYAQNDSELYHSLLKQFTADEPSKQAKIRRYYLSKDFKNYEILVHALKSTARMIGADALSERAKTLEELASAGGEGIRGEMHEEMIALYQKTANAIAYALDLPFNPEGEDDAGESILEFEPQEKENNEVILEFDPENKGGED